MGLIFKLNQPLLGFAVNSHRHLDRAGVDLLADIQVRDFPFFSQQLHAHQGHVHQGNGPGGILAVNRVSGVVIGL